MFAPSLGTPEYQAWSRTMALDVFYSYAHEDELLRDELEKHLSILRRRGLVKSWHDRQIGAGTEWRDEIDTHIRTAHIILLLISADFLASDYIYDVEMKLALDRHARHEAIVIPIILRPVDWSAAPFAHLQALPRDAKPVIEWRSQDAAFLDIAQSIGAIVRRYGASVESMPATGVSRSTKLSDSYIPRSRVLDAAIPGQVVKDVATRLLVLVRLPNSKGLEGVLLNDEEAEARPKDVRSAPFDVVFPLSPSGHLDPLKATVRLDSPDFYPSNQAKNIFIPADGDSDIVQFLLTPRRAGRLSVLVELQWEDVLRGSRSLRTECVAEATTIFPEPKLNVVRVPLNPGGSQSSEPSRSGPLFGREDDTEELELEKAQVDVEAVLDAEARGRATVDARMEVGAPVAASEVAMRSESRASNLTRIVIALIAAVPIALGSYWQFAYKPSHDQLVTVTGQVLNARTSEFTPKARVVLSLSNGASPLERYTDNIGAFSFKLDDVKQGAEGRLYVYADGFDTLEKNFTITDKSVYEDLRLQPTPSAIPPQPDKPLVVAGRVIDSDTGDGVGHARISLSGRSETYVTDDNGNFRIQLGPPIPTGAVRLLVKKKGCGPLDQVVPRSIDNLVLDLSCKAQPTDPIREEIEKIKNGPHEEMPPSQTLGHGYNGQTTTNFGNFTPYFLHFYLSGPTSQQFSIANGESIELHLASGSYELAVRAAEPNVTPSYGEQKYDVGTSNFVCFYLDDHSRCEAEAARLKLAWGLKQSAGGEVAH
jgi:hypothetical protein